MPTFHVQDTRPPDDLFEYSPAAREGPLLYVTVIEHVAVRATLTTSVALEPALTGEVIETFLTPLDEVDGAA